MSSRRFCSVCQATYRGIYPIHASTGRHLRNVHRREGRMTTRKARSRPAWMVALRRDAGGDREKVRAHRRSPPWDGTRKTRHVRGYWRRGRYIAAGRRYRPRARGRKI